MNGRSPWFAQSDRPVNLPDVRALTPTNRDDETGGRLEQEQTLAWILAGLAALPVAGLAAPAIGSIDGLIVAFAAGAVAGAIIGMAVARPLRNRCRYAVDPRYGRRVRGRSGDRRGHLRV